MISGVVVSSRHGGVIGSTFSSSVEEHSQTIYTTDVMVTSIGPRNLHLPTDYLYLTFQKLHITNKILAK